MAILRPFKGFRPKPQFVDRIASRPYDVLDSNEARAEVKGNPHSFLHVVKPEVDLHPDTDLHSPEVYQRANQNMQTLIDQGMFTQDPQPMFYIYGQTMWDKTQYGIVGCASVDDYLNNRIKKHELTRPDKEEDRMNHVRYTNANAEPVFFAYKDHPELQKIIDHTVAMDPEYDFVTPDGVGHHFWTIEEPQTNQRIEYLFRHEVENLYVADGHHRTAAAALVGVERRHNSPNHQGTEEYNFFMAVNFPQSHLRIIDYNRLVRDLNDLTPTQLLDKLAHSFHITPQGTQPYRPEALRHFALYLNQQWYKLVAKPGTWSDTDPVRALDVTILTEQVLEPILQIDDLRRSTRIDFVGGIRGLDELSRRVDSGEMQAAFALHPVSMAQLMAIADSGAIMPPKTTWFEPKLRSGLVFHKLD
jgi:uncharacterized protein (DUF1015 family)